MGGCFLLIFLCHINSSALFFVNKGALERFLRIIISRMSFLVRHIISLFFLDCNIGSNLATLATLCRKQHLPVKAHFRLCLPKHKPVPASCANILSGLKCLAMALDSELQG